jgi:Sulfotransferase family
MTALVPPSRDPRRFAPVFVLASARSCSSVVCAMVGQHPQLFGLPELKLFAYRTVGELDASLPLRMRERGFAHRSPGLVRAVAEFELGGQDQPALAAARAWLDERSGWAGEYVFDRLMEHMSPRAAVEKSPEHLTDPDALQRLARAYPRARYIHLTRHPISTIRSLVVHLGAGGRDARDSGSLVRYCVTSWLVVHERIVAFTDRLPGEQWLLLRAEEILNEPLSPLRTLVSWLGIRSDAEAIEAMLHPERSPFSCFAPASSGVEGGGDPAFLADPLLRPVAVERSLMAPAEWTVNKALWERVRRGAEGVGYIG